MTYPSVHETIYLAARAGLMVLVVPHGAAADEFLQDFPEILDDPQVQAILPIFETYLSIERDTGAGDLAHAIAHQLARRHDITTLVAEVSYPRGIIDGGRKLDHCLRSCLPTALFVRLKKPFLEIHQHMLGYMEELYQRMAAHEPAYLLDVHTMASFCPTDASGQRQILPVSFALLEEYVEQFINARNHAYQRKIDLITADEHGKELADPALTEACIVALREAGFAFSRNEPYWAAEAYLSHQHLCRTRGLSIDVPKHLIATQADRLSEFQLDDVTVDPDLLPPLAASLAKALSSMFN